MTPADGEQPGAGGGDVEVKDKPTTAADALVEKPFYDGFKDADLKGWAEKAGLKDAESAAKQLRDAQKLIGTSANKVDLPKPDEDITQAEIWDKLDVPKEAKGYEGKFKRPEMPEGLTYDEGLEKQYLEHAAKVRTPPHIVQQNIDFFAQQRVAEFNSLKEHQTKEAGELQTLFKEWGADKDTNIEFARRGAKFLGLTTEEAGAIEKGLIGGPLLMKALLKFGKASREGASVDGDASPVIGKEALKNDLAKLNDRIAKGETLSKEELAKRSALYKQIHG